MHIYCHPGMTSVIRIAIGLTALLTLTVLGCGDDAETPPPRGPLAEALGEIGGGGEHGSLGFGWTAPRLASASDVGTRLMATALGPNAETVVERAPAFRRRFGFDPLAAERLVSVGGSYAFGLRLDGMDTPRLRDALIGAGGRVRNTDGLEILDVGGYAVVPEPLLRSGVRGIGARDAFGPGLTVLAISVTARAALLGRGDRLLDEPIYRAAADCLGDVAAVRMVPERHLLSVEFGIDLVAIGVARQREVLCVLGGTRERAERTAAALRASLAPGAREPRTGEPMGDLVRAVHVEPGSHEDVEVVRAELRPAAGRPLGFLFATIARGSLVQLISGS
jgi:hypothetical protein